MKNYLFIPSLAMVATLFSCSSQITEIEKQIHENQTTLEQNDEQHSQEKVLKEQIMKARSHAKMIFSFSSLPVGIEAMESMTRGANQNEDHELLEKVEISLSKNIKMVTDNDICFLFKQNGLNEDLGFSILDYYEGKELMDIVRKYNLSNDDIQILANMSECVDYLKSQYSFLAVNSLNKDTATRIGNTGKAVMCTLAVVGSVGTTLSAVAIATPAGLAAWIFFKAVSLASIAGCAL